MVAKDSPEDLPSGWTVLFKVLRTGRKVSMYTNLETGKRFFSKDELVKHIKAGSSHPDKPLSTEKYNSRSEESTSLQPEAVNERDELPDWLPDGWKVEVKTRRSGAMSGKEYKCYVDPSNTGKFYSKPEVLRYLKSVKLKNHGKQDLKENQKSSTLEKKNPPQQDPTENHKSSMLESNCAQKNTAENHKNGMLKRNYAQEDATENHKSGMLEINHAQRDATDNHKSGILEETTETSMDSEQKVVVQRCVAEGLPAGWIKEIKIRQSAKTIRKDPFYMDPVSSYVFRSKKDALRYIQTGVISKHAFKPKSPINDPGSTKDEVSTSSAAKRQKLKHPPSQRQLFSGSSEMSDLKLSKTEGSKISSSKVSAEVNVTVSSGDVIVQDKSPIDDTTQDCAQENEKFVKNSSLLRKDEGSKRDGGKTSPVDKGQFVDKGQELGSPKEARFNSRKSTGKKLHNLPLRSSKRLAGHEPDKVANLELGERAFISSIKKSRNTEVVEDVNPTSDDSGVVNSKREEAEFVDHASNKANNPAVKASPEKSTALSPEELHHKLETETAIDNPEPQLSLLFGSDPCLEFAFKTLIGELPLDDTSVNGPSLTNSGVTVRHENLLESGREMRAPGKGDVSRSKSMNKKEINLSRGLSKRLSGGEPELEASSLVSEQTHHNASTKPHKKATIFATVSLDTSWQAESSNKRDMPFDYLAAPQGKQQTLDSGKAHFQKSETAPRTHEGTEMPEPDPSFSIADYWSDPCLDFAFKTLTGLIPIEDTLAQGYLQEQDNVSDGNKNGSGTLPEFGSSCFFQTDTSSLLDAPEKSSVGQQVSVSPSFMQTSSVGLSSCSGIHSQQQSLEGNKDLHQKVNS